MAIKERYRDNILYLFKRKQRLINGDDEFEIQGIPFRGNITTAKKSNQNVISGAWVTSTSTVIKTDTQIEFAVNDLVSKTNNPRSDANEQDFSKITNIDVMPINSKGNRYRTKEYYTRTLTID